jgi:hypothetical protein
MSFLNRRVGFRIYYNNQNINQITAIPLSTSMIPLLLNAGTIENKGIEVQFNATPFKTDFRWDLNLN